MFTPTRALLVSLALASSAFADAPTPTPTPKPKPIWELEFAYPSKYREANAKLGAPAPGEKRIVFFGDSITEGWMTNDPGYFSGKPYVDRGIAGQTTSQMLVRFRQDVINLKPYAVLILAGTNDIAQNGFTVTEDSIEQNLQSIAELAKANGIKVAFCSVLPAFDYPWHKGLEPAEKIVALNRWIQGYCRDNNLLYVDYYSPMVDSRHGMKAELSGDGVHPNKTGYAIMEPLADEAVRTLTR
jgi:lysophospholipase L1-like esterase